MKMRTQFLRCSVFALFALHAPHGFAQDDDNEDVFELSPFEVSTESDDRYYASNAISGSRLDVRIQDMPLTLEVLTSEFVEDTGSSDLRDSLRYSAGIVLQSQNDAFQAGTDKIGNVNNPEGATSAKSQSSFKIRGFVTNNTLRNGFRRQHSTDTVNIDRVEVLRGPSALLYGVGNFGGVVNYLTKTPTEFFQGEVEIGFGTDGWRRVTADVSGPLNANFGYRITAAKEISDDWTELRTHNHSFISPVLQWKWKKTKITADFEYGKAEDTGLGFQSVRAPTIVGIPITEADRLEQFGFLEFEGEDPRTFRWSGPDTYLNTHSWNGNFQIEQGITENLYVLVGYNKSWVNFDVRDIFGGIQTFEDPSLASTRAQPLLDTIQAIQIIDGQNSDVIIPVDNAVLRYNWTGSEEEIDWDQVRAEVNYTLQILQDRRWLASTHNFLGGHSYEHQNGNSTVFRTAESPDGDNFFYKNPTDPNPIRFDSPTDGSTPLAFKAAENAGGISRNYGTYLVYSGRFLNDRLFLVAGWRKDKSSSKDGYFEEIGLRQTFRTEFPDSEVIKETTQFGVSFEIIDGVSIYALQAEGVEPNFDGQRDGLGRALDSSVAESTEFGLKLNLMDGKIAATISVFEIEREGLPFSYWWSPAPIKGIFNRDEDIIYRLDEVNPDIVTDNPYLEAARPQWEAAKAAGDKVIFQRENEIDGREYTYINASTEEGAAFLDAVFDALEAEFALPRDQRNDSDPWPGFLYAGRDFQDSNVNNAGLDYGTGDFFQTINDKSSGWEAQVIFTPTDNLQLIINYSHVEREILDPGSFVEYPYNPDNWDRWAYWYFPNSFWGLAGVPADVAYPGGAPGEPNIDTSSWSGVGWGKGEGLDDTPPHVVSWWARYDFTSEVLDGLQIGIGGIWEDKREYASAFTSAGQLKQNETDTTIKAFTDARLTINAMVKYSFQLAKKHDATIQLNVDNVLDDQDQYGLIYAPGISARLRFTVAF